MDIITLKLAKDYTDEVAQDFTFGAPIDWSALIQSSFSVSENERYELGVRTNETINFLTGTDGMTIVSFTGGTSMIFQNNETTITTHKGVQTLVTGTKYLAIMYWMNQTLYIQ